MEATWTICKPWPGWQQQEQVLEPVIMLNALDQPPSLTPKVTESPSHQAERDQGHLFHIRLPPWSNSSVSQRNPSLNVSTTILMI